MSKSEKDFIVTKYARNLIRFKARQLCHRADFRSVEREEVEQRLWLALVKRAAGFTPDRASLDTYIDRVIATAIAMLVREQQSNKSKNGFRTQSLDDLIPGNAGQPEPLASAISEKDLPRRVGRTRSSDADQHETQEAFADALSHMTPEELTFGRRVMGGSLTSAARDINISRRQARRILQSVRVHFERAGFGPR